MGTSGVKPVPAAVVEPSAILRAREVVNEVYIDPKVKEYILDLVFATRDPAQFRLKLEGMLRYGASPRATIALTLAGRARAYLQGRGFVTPQDIKSVAHDVLRHRIAVSYEAEAEDVTSEAVIDRILNGLPVP
jgi:MoxR-like ATPase